MAHAAGRRLRHPESRLGRRLGDVAPGRAAVAVGAGDVGDRAALHDRLRHAALLGAVPDHRVAGPALVVGVEPARHLAQPLHVFDGPDAAAQVPDVDRIGHLLLGDLIPQPPDLQHPVHGGVVVLPVERARRISLLRRHPADLFPIKLLAVLAVADGERPGARPAVGEEAVHRVTPVDLAVDGRHLLGEIRAEHAGLVEPGGLVVPARAAVAVPFKPLRARLERFFIRVIAVHPRHHAQAALPRCRDHLTEQVARAEELAAVVVRDLGRVESDDAAAVQEHGIDLERGPVVGPGICVHGERVAFVEVDLAAAPHRGIPGFTVLLCPRLARRSDDCGGGGNGQELPARQGGHFCLPAFHDNCSSQSRVMD